MIPVITLGNVTTAVTTYTLGGPSTSVIGLASGQFTVALAVGILSSPVNITPHDGGAGGTFSVAFVTLSDGSRFAVFTYTRTVAGVVTISVTNSGSLIDPPPIVLNVEDPFTPDHSGSPIIELRPGAWRPGGRR